MPEVMIAPRRATMLNRMFTVSFYEGTSELERFVRALPCKRLETGMSFLPIMMAFEIAFVGGGVVPAAQLDASSSSGPVYSLPLTSEQRPGSDTDLRWSAWKNADGG